MTIAIALFTSFLVSRTVTPALCYKFLKPEQEASTDHAELVYRTDGMEPSADMNLSIEVTKSRCGGYWDIGRIFIAIGAVDLYWIAHLGSVDRDGVSAGFR